MAHLYVIPALDEPVAIILRRGPSRWYHLILWHTLRDEFTHGAWIKGRIYEDKCDLSPDGRLFVYFVHQGNRAGSEITDSWTAVSRAPWLHALMLWPQGTTYGGGGRFAAARTLWLRGVIYDRIHPKHPVERFHFTEEEPPPRPKPDKITNSHWCGQDHAGRIIFTVGDTLFRRDDSRDVIVADFSGLTPDPAPAPEWAKQAL